MLVTSVSEFAQTGPMWGQYVVVSAGALCSTGGSGDLVICYVPHLLCHSGHVGPCWPALSIHKV